MTQSDKWKQRPCVLKYRAFKDRVRNSSLQYNCATDRIIFHIAMPKSWSKKKRLETFGEPCTTRPDLDNYIKGLWDALYEEDSHIWRVYAIKIWSNESYIEIRGP